MEQAQEIVEILGPSRFDVWLTRTADATAPGLLAGYESLLSDDERRRLARFVHEGSRHQFLVARALLRTTLSRYANVAPERWHFTFNPHGRPELATGQTDLDLRFNLSHTDGLVACVVTLGRRVGIDVECHRRQAAALALAERFFSPGEARDIASQPPAERPQRFFQYWTLKESYMKAHGKGLAMPLRELAFHLAGETDTRIRLEPWPGDDSSRWQFWLSNPTPEHTLALAAEVSPEEPVTLGMETILPRA